MADVQEPQDVPAESSAATEPEEQALGTAPVTGEESAPPTLPDRPWQNLKGEFDRKFGKLERTVSDLVAVLAAQAQQQARPAPPPPAAPEYSDEQLRALAEQGNEQARMMLSERAAMRVTQQQLQQHNLLQGARGRLGELAQMYPALRDNAHPLTQEAMRRKHAYLASGQFAQTDPALADALATIQAIGDACTYHADLAVQARAPQYGAPAVPAEEAARRVAATTHQAVDGATPRRAPAPGQGPGQKPYRFTAKELEIAARMGVDPQKARERFAQRHDKSRSAVTPAVASIVKEQGGQL